MNTRSHITIQIIRRRGLWAAVAVGAVIGICLTTIRVESDEPVARTGRPLATPDAIRKSAPPRTLADAITFARAREKSLKHVANYTATFSKTESIERRNVSQTINLKFREVPFSVYMQYQSKRQPAREVIFVAGKNNDMLMVHESGMWGIVTLNLKPDAPRVMAESRYPVTEIGIAKMFFTALAIWEQEKAISPTTVEVTISLREPLGTMACEVVQVTHTQRLDGLKFHQTRLFFDKETSLPVQVEQYDWPKQAGAKPRLVEQYTYTDIKTNAGLTDADFDPHNSDYRFSVSRSR